MLGETPMSDREESRDEIRNRRLEKLRFWRRACADESEVLKSYNMEEPGNPLIFFHGDFEMGGFYLRRLAAECNYPIAAFGPHGLQDEKFYPSIRWMAEERLKHILAFKPSGPYRLGGYCNGSLLAYECAQLLQQRGHEVELVVMVEPSSINARPFYRRLHSTLSRAFAPADTRSSAEQNRFGHIMNAFWTAGRLARIPMAQNIAIVRKALSAKLRREPDTAGDEAKAQERQVREKNDRLTYLFTAATASYLPPASTLPTVVLSTGLDHGGRRCGLYDGTQWGRIASNFRHVPITGHHLSCLSDHVGDLALNMRLILRAPPAKPVAVTAKASAPRLRLVSRM
jgi:thioesterase domain-containing protein